MTKVPIRTKISVVSPVFMASVTIDDLVSQIIENTRKITNDFEIILVDDGSSDNSWEKIANNCKKNPHIKGIKLSRNFGQHYAISAGLRYSKGEWVVVMDCDLQDDPSEIINFYNKAITGWDVVLGRRVERQDHFLKKISNVIFYKALNYFTDTKNDKAIGTYRILNRKVVDYFNQFKEQSRFFSGLIYWLGFNICSMDIKHSPRIEGTKSTYTTRKLINLTIESILSFSDKPLKICIKFGFLMIFSASSFLFYKLIIFFMKGAPLIGWASTMVSMFFCTGLIIFVLGIIGLYISQIFKQTKERPLFVVQEFINF